MYIHIHALYTDEGNTDSEGMIQQHGQSFQSLQVSPSGIGCMAEVNNSTLVVVSQSSVAYLIDIISFNVKEYVFE